MRLVHPADWECLQNPLVHPLALERLFRIERTLVLIDHDAVLMKRIIAVPVKLLCKQPLARAEGIRRINDNQIICIAF